VLKEIYALGAVEMRVSKKSDRLPAKESLCLGVGAWKILAWKDSVLVLTLSFHGRNSSPRWKEIVEPYPGRFTITSSCIQPRILTMKCAAGCEMPGRRPMTA